MCVLHSNKHNEAFLRPLPDGNPISCADWLVEVIDEIALTSHNYININSVHTTPFTQTPPFFAFSVHTSSVHTNYELTRASNTYLKIASRQIHAVPDLCCIMSQKLVESIVMAMLRV